MLDSEIGMNLFTELPVSNINLIMNLDLLIRKINFGH